MSGQGRNGKSYSELTRHNAWCALESLRSHCWKLILAPQMEQSSGRLLEVLELRRTFPIKFVTRCALPQSAPSQRPFGLEGKRHIYMSHVNAWKNLKAIQSMPLGKPHSPTVSFKTMMSKTCGIL